MSALSERSLYPLRVEDAKDTESVWESQWRRRRRIKTQLICTNLSWTASRSAAEALGGHLATVTSPEEWAAILDVLGEEVLQKRLWIGGSDPVEGQWEWVTGETTFDSDPAHGPAHRFSAGTPASSHRRSIATSRKRGSCGCRTPTCSSTSMVG